MYSKLRASALLGAALLFSACTDATAPEASRNERPSGGAAPRIPAAQVAAVQLVSRGVALALDDASVRLAVRDAMRDSPWNEHKLVFQEFLATEGGTALSDAAAVALRMEQSEFLSHVSKLPAMDFYFPHGAQRQTWRGTEGVVVGATLAADLGTNYRWDSRGQAVPAPARRGVPAYPLLALIPAESKAVRQAPQPRGQGEVIEAANDGQRAESFRWIEPDGTVLTADMADIRAGRDPRFTLRMNTTSTGTTRIDCIKSTIRDGGEFAGNVELEIHAKFYGPNGSFLGAGEYKNHEFPEPNDPGETVTRCPSVPLVARVMPDQGTAKVNVELWEDDCDCWGNDDDFYGRRDIFWYDRDQYRDVGNDGNMLELDWIPIAPSVVSSVAVYSVTVYTGSTMASHATPIDQYGYYLPSQPVSSWVSSYTNIAGVDGAGTVSGYSVGATYLHATINGVTGTGTATVEEEPTGGGCGTMLIC